MELNSVPQAGSNANDLAQPVASNGQQDLMNLGSNQTQQNIPWFSSIGRTNANVATSNASSFGVGHGSNANGNHCENNYIHEINCNMIFLFILVIFANTFNSVPFMQNFAQYANIPYYPGPMTTNYAVRNNFALNFFGPLPSTNNLNADVKPFEAASNANNLGDNQNDTIVISDDESEPKSLALKSEPQSNSFLLHENAQLKKRIDNLVIHVEALQSRVLQQHNSTFNPTAYSTPQHNRDVSNEEKENSV